MKDKNVISFALLLVKGTSCNSELCGRGILDHLV